MKIVHLIPSLDPRQGGTVSYLRELVAAQRAAGDAPEIVSLDGAEEGAGPDPGVPHHRLPARRSVYRHSPELAAWLREHRDDCDAFVVHGLWQYPGFAAWRALRGSGRPYLVFPHGMLDPWFKRAHPLKHLKKWLYWPWAEYRVLRDAARVVFTAEEERRAARESFWLYDAREEVVPLGIAEPPEAKAGAFAALFPQAAGRRLFLFLGRLHAKKGCDLLLEAFAAVHGRNPEAVLMMAGPDGGMAAALRERARALGIEGGVLWPGMLEGEAKRAALAAAELFVLPSHHENFGIAVVEALAAGTPVLVSDRVNIAPEIAAAGAGRICRDTREGVVHALRDWEAMSSSTRNEMRSRARAAFLNRYRIDRSAARLREVLASVLGK